MPSPLDVAVSATRKYASEAKQKKHEGDFQAWKQWKEEPTHANMSELLKRHQPIFNIYAAKFKAPGVSEAAFHGKLQGLALKAYESYHPKFGTTVQTHLENSLRKVQRFNEEGQNMAKIPAGKQKYIGAIDTARDSLLEAHAREPTWEEIHGFLRENPSLLGTKKLIPATKLEQIDKLRRKDLTVSKMESDSYGQFPSLDQQHFPLLRNTLNTERQKQVFDHLNGLNGHPKAESKGAIAKKLGISASDVSRDVSVIEQKYKQYF